MGLTTYPGSREGSWYRWSEDNLQPCQAPVGRSLLSFSVSNFSATLQSALLILTCKVGLSLLICCHCRSQKFEDPAEGEAALVAKFTKLHEDLTTGFRNLEDETR